MSKKMFLIEITNEDGKVIFCSDVEIEEGKEGGLVRHLSSFLDEHYGEED